MRTPAQTLQILVIDDDLNVLAMLAETLRGEGHKVDTAVDGAHGLQRIAASEIAYDLLIVDGRMPHLDGWRLIMQARAGRYRGRIILFSAWLSEDERDRYRELQIDRMIEKPPRPGELLQAIREITA